MAEREDLELQRRTAPEGSEKRGQKSGQQVPEGESKEKRQLPVYQSDRILGEPHPRKTTMKADPPSATELKDCAGGIKVRVANG